MRIILLLLLANLVSAQTRSALVVGVNEYADTKHLPKLKYAENDATVLGRTLTDAGFSVTTLTGKDATKAAITEAYGKLLKAARGKDLVLVALAGHGQQFQPQGKSQVEPFFCPAECAALDAGTQVNINLMIANAGLSPAGKVLFLVDACRTDPDPNSRQAEGLNGNAVTLNAQTMALFAAAYKQQAREHADAGGVGRGHGLFMSEVIAGFRGEARNRHGDITWNSLNDHVTYGMFNKSARLFPNLKDHQTPHAVGNVVGEAVIVPAARKEDPDEFEQSFEFTATNLSKFLRTQKVTDRIAVTYTPRTGSSKAGAGYEILLKEALAKRGIKVVPNAEFTFKGTFGADLKNKPFNPDQAGIAPVPLVFRGTVVNADGEPVKVDDSGLSGGFESSVYSHRRVAEALGLSLPDLHVPRKHDALINLVSNNLTRPRAFILDGTMVRASATSAFGVQVLVNGKPLPLEDVDGRPTFRIGLDDEYEIRLHNRGQFETAVSASIDGISSFHFAKVNNAKTGKPFRYHIVDPGTVRDLAWFITPAVGDKPGEELKFKIVPPGQGAAAQAGVKGQTGQITVTFHAAWEEDKQKRPLSLIPRDEPKVDVMPDMSKVGNVIMRQVTFAEPFTLTIVRNGDFVKSENTRNVTKTVQQFATMSMVETGFGTSRTVNSEGVARVIGAERDTITLYYIGK